MKEYNIGLDIGVASVGWCVTDIDGNLIKNGNRNLWGARLFSEANTAAQTRAFRSSRRRNERRKKRIDILQSILKDDIDREYPNFLPLLRETSLTFEDKKIASEINGKKFNIFTNEKYTDMDYYREFPTIYHLRNYLVETKNKVDIRLVYLALHHIIKYRGNFLYEGDFNSVEDISEEIKTVVDYLTSFDLVLTVSYKELENIILDKKLSKSEKKDNIKLSFKLNKENKAILENCINAILGYTFDITKIFEDIQIEKNKITFSKEIEEIDKIEEQLGNDYDIFEALNKIYTSFTLNDIFKGNQGDNISKVFIQKYEKYQKDLKILKDVYKRYLPTKKIGMFRKYEPSNYVHYNGKNGNKRYKRCEITDFYSKIKNDLKGISDDVKEKIYILKEIDNETFLRRLNVTDNGAIPRQLHEKELKLILENQLQYYKTIDENKENIIKLFEFRIPYYIGPLEKDVENNRFSWIVRKSDENIRPWNFEDVVDIEQTAENFIKRMTNKCTYLINKDVIPKNSILYSEFCLLNELNNIRINDIKLKKDFKNKAIEVLFKNKKNVKVEEFKKLYEQDGKKVNDFTGTSEKEKFASSLSSYNDMKEIFGKVDEDNIKMCEELIYWITIFEDKKMLKRKIMSKYGKILTSDQIKNLIKLKYKGWSRLSKELLLDLKSNNNESIMDILRKTNLNFMQIINSDEYGINKKLEDLLPQTDKNIQYKDIEEIPTSPANKRAIWQSILVVKDIVKKMKNEPKNIFIEFARNEEKDKVRKDNRAKKLLKLYENLNEQLSQLKSKDSKVYKELKGHQNDKEISEKLYLYFIQGGKSMYSGKTLEIDELSNYEVDHIVPQSYIKDDSIDNKALVLKSENQRKKDDLTLSDDIINTMESYWKKLLDNGLISQNKYFKLRRRKMFETNDNIEKFIKRQLVETRQITKYVTNLLKNLYEDTNIYSLRANLTHNFRMKFGIYKNRDINDLHHAQDAYIISYIGSIIDKEWIGKEDFKYGEYLKRFIKDESEKSKDRKQEKYGILLGFINNRVDIVKVKKYMEYKDYYISRMLEENTGAFYDQTKYGFNVENTDKKPVLPLKNEKDPNKYGGYSGEQQSYYTIVSYTDIRGKEAMKLIGIPIKVAYDIKSKKVKLEEYLLNNIDKIDMSKEIKIIREKILKNQEYLDENNEPMILCSSSEIRVAKQLVVDMKFNKLIYLLNQNENQISDDDIKELNSNYNYIWNYLLEKLYKEYKAFSNEYNKLKDKDIMNLSDEDKKSAINGLIKMLHTGQGNLKTLNLSDRLGRKNFISFNLNNLSKITFICKSPTGIFERRYKVNGMENSCSK